MKNFSICYKKEAPGAVGVKDTLENILRSKGMNVQSVDVNDLPVRHVEAQPKHPNTIASCEDIEILRDAQNDGNNSPPDFTFVIGGDGTILKAARFFAKSATPIFGINMGRLGFLSQASQEDIESAVGKILEGKFRIEERIMLSEAGVKHAHGGDEPAGQGVTLRSAVATEAGAQGAEQSVIAQARERSDNTALNDFVIKSTATGRTSRFLLKINDKPVCDYLADGIIISTPTGSTAYGLSAGGPVLAPSLDAFVIVAICPHTLTARPLVVPGNEKIVVEIQGTGVVSADGQEFYEFNSEISIKKSKYNAKLALLEDSVFYSTLHDKMHWGVSQACK